MLLFASPDNSIVYHFPMSGIKQYVGLELFTGRTKRKSRNICMHTLNGVSEEEQEGHGVAGLEHGAANLLAQAKPGNHFA